MPLLEFSGNFQSNYHIEKPGNVVSKTILQGLWRERFRNFIWSSHEIDSGD